MASETTRPSTGLTHLFPVLARAIEETTAFVIVCEAKAGGRAPVVYANTSFCAAIGIDAAGIVGVDFTALLAGDTPESTARGLSQRLETLEAVEYELQFHGIRSPSFWAEVVGHVVHNEDHTLYWVITGRDITMRRQAQTQLALLASAIEQSHDAIVLYDVLADGSLTVAYENTVAQERGSYTILEALSNHTDDAASLHNTLLSGALLSRWSRRELPDGRIEYSTLRAHALRNHGGAVFAIVSSERFGNADATTHIHKPRRNDALVLSEAIGALLTEVEYDSRCVTLSSILEHFGAHFETVEPVTPPATLVMNTGTHEALFPLPQDHRTLGRVKWTSALSARNLTSLRLIIAAFLRASE